MARPRKPPPTAWERRNRAARDRGYRNYYDYRLHRYGKVPPGPLQISPEQRAERRGHRGRADALQQMDEGDLVILPRGLSSIDYDPDARGGQGAYREIEILVVDAVSGRERTFTLRNMTRDELVAFVEAQQESGAVFSPSPSLDLRRLASDAQVAGGY